MPAKILKSTETPIDYIIKCQREGVKHCLSFEEFKDYIEFDCSLKVSFPKILEEVYNKFKDEYYKIEV